MYMRHFPTCGNLKDGEPMKLLCTSCRLEKPESAFFHRPPYREGSRAYSYDCKDCRRLNRRKRKLSEFEELSEVLFGQAIDETTKKCKRCGEIKVKDLDFYPKKSYCISCAPLVQRELYEQCEKCKLWHKKGQHSRCHTDLTCIVCGVDGAHNPMFSEKICLKCKENERLRGAVKKYGMTVEQFEDLFQKQGGKCAICKLTSKRRLAIDHDHKTGRVRGLLCVTCNLGIGNFQDNPDTLVSAAAYLTTNN